MKKFLFLLFICFYAPVSGQQVFYKTYDRAKATYPKAVIETDQHTYLIVAESKRPDTGLVGILLINVDTVGQVIWEKFLPDNGTHQSANSIIKLKSGGFVIAGTTRRRPYIVKIDSIGTLIWSKVLVGPLPDEKDTTCIETYNKDLVLVGKEATYTRIYRIGAQGNFIWAKTYPSISSESIAQTSDSGFVMPGIARYNGNSFMDYIMIKTNPQGDSLWQKFYRVSERGDVRQAKKAYDIIRTRDQGLIITGLTESPWADGQPETFMIKTDHNGDSLWSGNFAAGVPTHIVETQDGGFASLGFMYKYDPFPFGLYTPFIDLSIIDSSGRFIWWYEAESHIFAGTGNQLQQTSDGGYLITCHKETKSDIILIKLNAYGHHVTSLEIPLGISEAPILIYPNPAHKEIKIETRKGIPISHITVYSSWGQKIQDIESSNALSLKMDLTGFESGVYIMKIRDNQGSQYLRKFLVEK